MFNYNIITWDRCSNKSKNETETLSSRKPILAFEKTIYTLLYTHKSEQLSQSCHKNLLSTICYNSLPHHVKHCCQQPLFTVNNVHGCSIIVDNQGSFINKCRLLSQQHCNNYCSSSTSNNYSSNNAHQHCHFNKCC